MYILNKYCFNDGLVKSIFLNKTQQVVKLFFIDYIKKFCVVNTNQNVEYTYDYNEDFTIGYLYEKKMIINSGYIYDSITYDKKVIESFSICYHSKFSTANINLLCSLSNNGWYNTYDKVIQQMKKNTLFKKSYTRANTPWGKRETLIANQGRDREKESIIQKAVEAFKN
jgi:hypothetical protein